MSLEPLKVGRLNRAVLWHLQLCLRLLDRLGYHSAAANVSSAIDALIAEARSNEEISEMDIEREERFRLILEMFKRHESIVRTDTDSSEGENGLD